MLTARTFGRRRRVSTRRVVLVRVRSQYEPAMILATAGEPILLRFRLETFAPSSRRVIFPALGKSIELPLFGEVALELLPEQPGRYEFTCERGLLRGVLEIDERRAPRSTPIGAARRSSAFSTGRLLYQRTNRRPSL